MRYKVVAACFFFLWSAELFGECMSPSSGDSPSVHGNFLPYPSLRATEPVGFNECDPGFFFLVDELQNRLVAIRHPHTCAAGPICFASPLCHILVMPPTGLHFHNKPFP